jgi:hypothetical protein
MEINTMIRKCLSLYFVLHVEVHCVGICVFVKGLKLVIVAGIQPNTRVL